jgi:hypothetical protein
MPRPTNWRSRPSADFRFFLYDPDGDGFMFFATAEERDQAAPGVISEYSDDGWSEEVTGVCAGELTATTHQTGVEHKPRREDFDSEEDFEGAMEDWPNHDFDTTCNYELKPLAAAK